MATINGVDEMDLAMLIDYKHIGAYKLMKGEETEMERFIEKIQRAIEQEKREQ